MRVGQGFDVHAFGPDRPLILGGVKIDHPLGMVAHSDGDVLIHALCDALLGAAALGDIGHHFPDNDARYANADSRKLLRAVRDMVAAEGWAIANVDTTIVAQAPRLAPHIDSMRRNLAADLQLELRQVNIKATTSERMGFTGREEGIAAFAVALLVAAAAQ